MALIKNQYINQIEAITVKDSAIMLVQKTNRFMLLPIELKNKLNEQEFVMELQEQMDKSAAICREHICNSNIDIEMLVENKYKKVDKVEILSNIERVTICRDGKTLSFAHYEFQGGWCLKVYPRYGLEDGIYTPNIGRLELPDVFGHLVIDMMNKVNTNNLTDWHEFFVMCFDQFITMCTTND